MVDFDCCSRCFYHLEIVWCVFDVPLVCQNRKNTQNKIGILCFMLFVRLARISLCGIFIRLASAFLFQSWLDAQGGDVSAHQRGYVACGFLDAEDKQKAEDAIKEKQKQAEKAAKQNENRDSKEKEDDVLAKIYTALRAEYPVQKEKPEEKSKPESKQTGKGKQYMTQSLSKYNKKEQKLISHIYGILKAILPRDTATMVINKIQEELSK